MSASGSSELGPQLEHVVKLCENAPAPKVVLFQEVARTGAGKLGPAEKSRQFVGHFDCACREHGSTMSLGRALGNRAPGDLPAVLH
jgi:hypothetical protein